MTARYSDEIKAEACRRYLGGEATTSIARSLGTNTPRVCKWLQKAGISRRQQKGIDQASHGDVCRRYQEGETSSSLAKCYGVHQSTVLDLLDANGIARRSTREAHGGVPRSRYPEIAKRYLSGETTVELARSYGVSPNAICRYLREEGVDRRQSGGYADNVQDAIQGKGRHQRDRETDLYVFSLAAYPSTHCKVGIAFDTDHRQECGQGQYGEEHVRIRLRTRREAYFLEQAILSATAGAAHVPEAMAEWIGFSEIRAMPAHAIAPIAERLAAELEQLGAWEFAVRYVPMTAGQRAVCLERAA